MYSRTYHRTQRINTIRLLPWCLSSNLKVKLAKIRPTISNPTSNVDKNGDGRALWGVCVYFYCSIYRVAADDERLDGRQQQTLAKLTRCEGNLNDRTGDNFITLGIHFSFNAFFSFAYTSKLVCLGDLLAHTTCREFIYIT